jgi:uncharacterized RDD family membrane protein YckC
MNYHIAKNGAQLGVLSEEEITSRLASGQLSSNDLFWTDGMAEWQPLGSKFRSPASFPPPSSAASINPYAAPASNVLRAPSAGESFELADRGTRLGASIIEGLVFLLAASPMIIAVGFKEMFADGLAEESSATAEPTEMNFLLLGLGLLLVLGVGIYQLVMLATRGQSIGKRLLGIRIVTHPDAANPGGVKTIIMRGFVPGIISNIPLLGPIFSIVNVCFIFREDRRCIHDLIAGTQVVKGQPPQ